ncbi:hypothetical protein DPMN_132507 [Dreissena polymorpha]|uniref:Glycoside hydrolase family 38 N-terminal domain-containing protein n=1 Tax=Dreissena polymorpha TaxID=45954 RepID=A0A9D4FWW7_DREPO|nr:hypothetical protein DPMN_132507 [Dreissena polymorpha]
MRNATPVRKVVRTIICASIGIIALCLLYSYIYHRWEPVKVVYTVEHIKHVEKAQSGNENEHPVVVVSSDGERGVENVSKGPGDHYAINRSGEGIHFNEAEKSTIEATDGKHDLSRKVSDIKGTETTMQSSESLPRVLPRTFLPPSVLSTNSSRNDHLPPLRAPPVSVVENKTSVLNLETSKDDISDEICDIQNAWTGAEHNITSTYDILKSLDYKTDTNGAYPIPVKAFEDITKHIENRSDILNVFLVPFSHADPGYGLTFEQYYSQKTSRTLNLMVQKLLQYPNMTFQWAETVFLARWFRDLNDETKENVRALIKRGQLEIVLGGWVMPDEASTHYITVVDQLIEGHQWLDEHLSVKPTTAWVNDPFGYSTTMPYLWKLSGMDNLLILRINQNLKAKLMSKNSLEFFWRPYWKHLRNDSDVLTSLMPFTNYWIDDVCGPNQIICSIFNYLHIGEKGRNAVQVTEENVHILAELLYRQLRVTGELYQFNNLYIGLGEDFSYTRAQEWDNTYLNFEKILTYINNKSEWNMRIKFGTMSEYFANIRQQAKLLTSIGETTRNAASTFPVLSGDFFPYTERNQEFWTGYFTTRPLLKKFSRDIETLIRGADIFNVMAHSMFKHYW